MNEIFIETDQAEYEPGQTIKGRCVLRLDKPIPARGVRIRLHGFEHSHWTTGSGKNQRTHSQTHDHFNHLLTVWGQPELSTSELLADALSGLFSREKYELLQAGEQAWDFEYPLPEQLPADFESQGSNRIAYEVTAYVDMPLRLDLSTKIQLGIREPFDLSCVQEVAENAEKNFLFDSSGPLNLAVTLERNTFCANDRVRGQALVTNESAKRIVALSVNLVRILDLKAGSSSARRTEQTPLGEIRDPEIPRGQPTTLPLDFALPEDLYCSIPSGRLVRVSYELKVNLDVPWAIDLAAELPIRVVE